MRLILFDIDGTLIHSNRAGRESLVEALVELFGTAGPVDDYQMAGKTDPLIVQDLLGAAGYSQDTIAAQMPTVFKVMAEKGKAIFPNRGIAPCAGVPELLQTLVGKPTLLLGLLTGNIAATAPLKLAAAGIDPGLFQIGAYGSDAADRNELPRIAMERAAKLTGRFFHGSNTVVIGDTPADVLCAHAAGATSVAVASGGFTAGTLAQHEPDFLFDDLTDTLAVQRILVGKLPR